MRAFLRTFSLLLRRRGQDLKNRLRSLTLYEWTRNSAFVTVGLWMLVGLYFGFIRVIAYLAEVQLIGGFLVWKLTAMAMLTTFAMVILSSLIISLTSLFYASDLKHLMRSPVPLRAIFFDKSLETIFFSSWMIGLALFPYIVALGEVYGYGRDFYLVFCALLPPFLVLAAVAGMAFTLSLMHLFPSSRTRDVVWILSSLSVAGLYVLLRFSQPERLIRPDALQLVGEYLQYLQAPTAPYAPSWWATKALMAYVNGQYVTFARFAGALFAAALGAYALLIWASGFLYARGYSGAQEGRRIHRESDIPATFESRVGAYFGRFGRGVAALYWKERKSFFRDVKHWSQIVLIGALISVYLFSISRLPLDHPDLKSLVCFLNIGIAGFVMASLGLRFTFPSVSLEGRSYWVVRSAPLTAHRLMLQKFIFSLGPMLLIATVLVAASNYLLGADRFITLLSLGTIWVAAGALAAMGVGLGAYFPRFRVENIHQIESSVGGFVYMACALCYVALIVAAEAWPVKMHFAGRMGHANAWDWRYAWLSFAMVAAINLIAYTLPWWIGRRNLDAYEEDV